MTADTGDILTQAAEALQEHAENAKKARDYAEHTHGSESIPYHYRQGRYEAAQEAYDMLIEKVFRAKDSTGAEAAKAE